MVRDLSDPHEFARRNQAALRRTKTPTTAQRTAVDRGAFRVKSPEGMEVGTVEDPNGSGTVYGTWTIRGLLEVLGQLAGSGSLNWTGPATISGALSVTGPWTISGDGDITGDIDATGDWRQSGDFEVLGGGRIKVGNVILTPGNGGRITIGTGASQIILDPSQLKVGPAFRMDPAHSSNGAQMEFGPDGDATIYGGPDGLMFVLDPGGDSVGVQILPSVALGAGPGVVLNGEVAASDLTPLPQGEAFETVVRSKTTGILHSFAGGTGGGPGDGIFAWSFSLDLVTSEFGMRENPATGEYALHQGIDFGMGIANIQGTPIPAAGSGTVEIAGVYAGYGNAVVINHGIDPTYDGGTHEIKTLYGHMYQTPDVSVGDTVALGQALGGIGQTGQSFGNHLHFEVWVDGVKINPRDFMSQHGG